jgi:outer membrane protein W
VVALVVGVWATPPASAQQMLNFYIGGFTPRSEDARVPNDVLVNDIQLDQLAFNVSDFGTAQIGAEYLIGFGDKFEAGLGIGYQQRSVDSVYADVINGDTGGEIAQTLRLRIVPFTATVRFLPLGHNDGIQPYIGGGVGVFAWRYSETGEFVDENNKVFPGNYVGSGGAAGPMILGGIRVPIGNWGLGGELRWQSAEGNLPIDEGFVTDTRIGNQPKIDLSGLTYLFSVHVRF